MRYIFFKVVLLVAFTYNGLCNSQNSSILQKKSNTTHTSAKLSKGKRDKEEKKREVEILRQQKIAMYKDKLTALEKEISSENTWIKSYASYLTSLEVRTNLKKIEKRIKHLTRHAKSISEKDELNALIAKVSILNSQVNKLKGKDAAPFAKLITPPNIGDVSKITTPFDIFTGFSTIKKLNANFEDYKLKRENLMNLIVLLRKENEIYKKLQALDTTDTFQKRAKYKQIQLERLETALDTIDVTLEVYQRRLEIVEINIHKGIQKQVYRLIRIGTAVLAVFFIFFLFKLVVKKYITDNERFYMANKFITFANFTIIILILFFNYIENAAYLVTILGFASAGIAIAMKDWFMSILGWLVIVFGGSIHVGDRIRVDMDGMKYVGDVMDISLLRMTILEDITLTSIRTNRRAGRIMFIPNNYVFTNMIANYTHNSLKTVWDGVKITITFDSNHKKAMHIAKEITKKFSKGYTDITRKQLNKLREHYSLKNTNVEPRIFSFIEANGMDIEAWYLTNAYATLTLRSVISTEIVDAFNAEDDITIAYPTQKLYVEKQEALKPPFEEKELL